MITNPVLFVGGTFEGFRHLTAAHDFFEVIDRELIPVEDDGRSESPDVYAKEAHPIEEHIVYFLESMNETEAYERAAELLTKC